MGVILLFSDMLTRSRHFFPPCPLFPFVDITYFGDG